MTLTTADAVRLRIQDQPLLADVTRAGDGTASAFLIPQRNLTSGTAYVPIGATAWSATAATFDATGMVSFSGVISAASAFRLTYVYSVFSDSEIGQFTAVGGNVNGASLEACLTLMFDGLKRAAWAAPDGSTYSDVAAMSLLRDIYSALKAEQVQDAIGNGGVVGWSENQGSW